MSTSSTVRIVAVLSLISLFHSAYSAAQHRLYLRLTQQPFSSLPFDIQFQTLVSLTVLIFACSHVAGNFQPIRADIQNQKRKWEDVGGCPSFITFDHRAKALSPAFALLTNRFGVQFTNNEKINVIDQGFGYVSMRPKNREVYTWPNRSSGYISTRPFSSQDPPPLSPANSTSTPQSPDFSRLPGARSTTATSPITPTPRKAYTEKEVQDALSHCVSLTRKHDAANFAAALLMPRKVQNCILSLLATNIEIALTRDKVSAVSSSPMYRLQFWRDTFKAIYQGVGPVPKQPTATALVCFAPSASQALLDSLVTSRQKTIGDRAFPSLQEVCSYGINSTGALIRLLMGGLGAYRGEDEAVERAVDSIAESYACLNLIRSCAPFTLRGVVLLPSDVLSFHSLTADNVVSGKKPAEMKMVVKHLREEGAKRLAISRSLRPSVSPPLRPALLATAAQCEHIIWQVDKADYEVRSPLLQRPRPLLLWKLLARRIARTY